MNSVDDALFLGPVAELEAVLAAREARVARRQEALSRLGRPTVTVMPVMPGPVKDCAQAAVCMRPRSTRSSGVFRDRKWPAFALWEEAGPTGPAALYAVEADSDELKRALIDLEIRHPMGRLWDLDVTDPRLARCRAAVSACRSGDASCAAKPPTPAPVRARIRSPNCSAPSSAF